MRILQVIGGGRKLKEMAPQGITGVVEFSFRDDGPNFEVERGNGVTTVRSLLDSFTFKPLVLDPNEKWYSRVPQNGEGPKESIQKATSGKWRGQEIQEWRVGPDDRLLIGPRGLHGFGDLTHFRIIG